MGLLEDAIREHLDLKRRHGAPEEELERQAAEVLGPEEQEAAPEEAEAEAAAGEPEAAAAEPPAAPGEGVAPDGAEPAQASFDEPELPPSHAEETALLDHAEPDETAPHAPAEVPEDDLGRAAGRGGEHLEEPPADRPGPEEPRQFREPEQAPPDDLEEPPAHPSSGDTPPRGLSVVGDDEHAEDYEEDDDYYEDEPEGEGEDVLEDTPDFLQETPEHDRLWFEQRPPRDFDFD